MRDSHGAVRVFLFPAHTKSVPSVTLLSCDDETHTGMRHCPFKPHTGKVWRMPNLICTRTLVRVRVSLISGTATLDWQRCAASPSIASTWRCRNGCARVRGRLPVYLTVPATSCRAPSRQCAVSPVSALLPPLTVQT